MFITVICFTEEGSRLAKRIKDGLIEDKVTCFMKSKAGKPANDDVRLLADENGIDGLVERCFCSEDAIIFVGAAGIAVRKIAPFIKGKTEDPAVLVVDELGMNVISLLSGHVGGANDLTIRLSKVLNAYPVITTSTDINGKFAVDTWARKKRIDIDNPSAIKEVSAKVLRDEELKIGVLPDIIITEDMRTSLARPELLKLRTKRYLIGVGCKKDKSPKDLEAFLNEWLNRLLIETSDIACIASIDLKKDESCITEWAVKHDIPFVIFSADELSKAQGDFTSSDFVNETTGVDNVCERAAVSAGKFYDDVYGKLIFKKYSKDGMTLAVAVRMM